MDLPEIVRHLREHRDQIDAAISSLERLRGGETTDVAAPSAGRRGRKSMDPEERKIVAERMRAYWAARRNDK